MHARQIWSKGIIVEYRQSCYTALSLSPSIFFLDLFCLLCFWTKFVDFHEAKRVSIDPSGETSRRNTSFPSRRRRFSLLFAHQRRFTSIQTWNGKKTVGKPGRNTENICNLNSPGEKRIRYFRDSVLRYLGTAAGEFQKWVLEKFVYPRRWMQRFLLRRKREREKKEDNRLSNKQLF